MVNTNPEKEHEIYNSLLKNNLVVELIPLYKEYDMIAKVKTENREKLGTFVSDEIRPLNGVIDTKILQ